MTDSHWKRIHKNKCNECLPEACVSVKSFSRANTNQLDYYVFRVLVDEKPNNVATHIR